ncbi:hypothetical protein MUK42_08080 [Musa troglodytarum]|uniref:Uncharacterized protein n=1 Tax=Musa troglodytarum TaxID=320322 RepID=A0A9E7FJJ5_9LILI|nr:hypothetical protein MUK42_08080 [Musa troglodytarum]
MAVSRILARIRPPAASPVLHHLIPVSSSCSSSQCDVFDTVQAGVDGYSNHNKSNTASLGVKAPSPIKHQIVLWAAWRLKLPAERRMVSLDAVGTPPHTAAFAGSTGEQLEQVKQGKTNEKRHG